MARLLVLPLIAALLSAGCATARISPGASPKLGPNEGLLAFAADTDTPFDALVFSRDSGVEGFTFVVPERGVTIEVLKLPAGRYVLTDFRTHSGGLSPASEGGRLCLEVKPHKTSYPGHFVFRDTNQASGLVGQASWGWRPNEADLRARLSSKWPGLTDDFPLEVEVCR